MWDLDNLICAESILIMQSIAEPAPALDNFNLEYQGTLNYGRRMNVNLATTQDLPR